MKKHDVFPQTDSGFDLFQTNLMKQVNTNQSAWHINATELLALQQLQQPWITGWDACKTKEHATTVNRTAKNDAKKVYIAALRKFISRSIQCNPSLTDADRIACDITPRKHKYTKSTAPKDAPLVVIKPITGQRLNLYFSQLPGNEGSSRRSKPDNILLCKFVYTIGNQLPASPADCPLHVLTGKSPLHLQLNAADEGKHIYGFGCWVNRVATDGPWSVMFGAKIV